MFDCFITFRSLTAAQRGEQVLLHAGIPVQMQRTPQAIAVQGCGYSLRMGAFWCMAATRELSRNQLAPGRVYRKGAQGFQEVVL